MKALEDVASLYVGRWEDYKDAVKDDSLQLLMDALAMEPTSKTFNQGAFNLMACELLLRNREDGANLLKDCGGLMKFAANVLGLPKKDLPSTATARMDKLSKDASISFSVCRGGSSHILFLVQELKAKSAEALAGPKATTPKRKRDGSESPRRGRLHGKTKVD